MENKESSLKTITQCLDATETAIEAIREGDIYRRETSLELRGIQLLSHENLGKLKSMLAELEEQIDRERVGNTKWMERRVEQARAVADAALNSTLMVKDVQTLEKKVNILKDSIIQMNKSYRNYSANLDMKDLKEQVIEMVQRIERMEREALDGYPTDEPSMERVFRGAIEGLYGLQSSNPKVMQEAKKLAQELSVFRDAAANKNFYAMISSKTGKSSAESLSASSSEAQFTSDASGSSSSSHYQSTNTPSTSSTLFSSKK
ncbi:unnamed protein product [Caenorhabditis nigoni]